MKEYFLYPIFVILYLLSFFAFAEYYISGEVRGRFFAFIKSADINSIQLLGPYFFPLSAFLLSSLIGFYIFQLLSISLRRWFILAVVGSMSILFLYIEPQRVSSIKIDSLKDFLADPILPVVKKDLIIIFGESFERRMFEEAIEFRELVGSDHYYMNLNVTDTDWNSWTTSGFISSLCGFLDTDGDAEPTNFLTNVLYSYCIPGILGRNSYTSTFVLGGSSKFDGLGAFLRRSGFDEICDKSCLVRKFGISHGELSQFGVHDSVVFEKLTAQNFKLEESNRPYLQVAMTLDTHAPLGMPSAACKSSVQASSDIMRAAICVNEYLINTLEEFRRNDREQNNVYVFLSDHLLMPSRDIDWSNRDDRANTFLLFGPGVAGLGKVVSQDKISKFDVAATILNSIGGGRALHFGRSNLALQSNQTDVSAIDVIVDETNILVTPNASEGSLQTVLSGKYDLELAGPIEVNPAGGACVGCSEGGVAISSCDKNFGWLCVDNSTEFSAWRDRENCELRSSVGRKSVILEFPASVDCHKPRFRAMTVQITLKNTQVPCCKFHSGILDEGASNMLGSAFNRIRLFLLTILPSDLFDALRTTWSYFRWTLVDWGLLIDKSSMPKVTHNLIAHAAGSIDGFMYTNSLEALNKSYSDGARFFELDIQTTSDGSIVATHDWELWKKQTGFVGSLPPSLKEFRSLKIEGRYTPLSIEEINEWFGSHPDAFLVTDKINDPEFFTEVFDFPSRLQMELFDVAALESANKVGLTNVVLAIGAILDDSENHQRFLNELDNKYEFIGLALSRHQFIKHFRLVKHAAAKGYEIYVYGVNDGRAYDGERRVMQALDGMVNRFYVDHIKFESQ